MKYVWNIRAEDQDGWSLDYTVIASNIYEAMKLGEALLRKERIDKDEHYELVKVVQGDSIEAMEKENP